jgi:hypothetical protein
MDAISFAGLVPDAATVIAGGLAIVAAAAAIIPLRITSRAVGMATRKVGN